MLCTGLFLTHPEFHQLDINKGRLWRFVQEISARYRNLPFHSFRHAVDVTLCTSCMVRMVQRQDKEALKDPQARSLEDCKDLHDENFAPEKSREQTHVALGEHKGISWHWELSMKSIAAQIFPTRCPEVATQRGSSLTKVGIDLVTTSTSLNPRRPSCLSSWQLCAMTQTTRA